MPLVQPDTLSFVPLKEEAKIDKKIARLLTRYMRFSGASQNKVVSTALEKLFDDDEEFQEWLANERIKEKEREQKRAKRSQGRPTSEPTLPSGPLRPADGPAPPAHGPAAASEKPPSDPGTPSPPRPPLTNERP